MKYGVLFIFFWIGVFGHVYSAFDAFRLLFSVYLLGKAFCYFDDLRVIFVLFYSYVHRLFALAGHFGTSCSLSLTLTI